jgi:transposase
MWPGNTVDVKALLAVIDRLRQRFAIGRICMVADRGMISARPFKGWKSANLIMSLARASELWPIFGDGLMGQAAANLA